MGVTKYLYSFGYRHFRAPWDGGGPRSELVEFVESGRIPPCRAIDLGSGTGWNVIFLAQHGFEATGVDFAPGAVELGRRRASDAGVTVNFQEDDFTHLRHVSGPFDLLVDYGTFDDLPLKDRELYLNTVLPLTRPGSRFLLYCFEWQPRWWEQPFFFGMVCEPGEIERRFGPYFEVERCGGETHATGFPRGWAVYLMTRKVLSREDEQEVLTAEGRGRVAHGGKRTTTDERRKEMIEMTELELTVEINRPIEEVFAFVTDIEKMSQWMSDLVEAKQTSEGPVGVGATIRAVANPLGRRAESTQEVTEYEPNSKFAFKSTSGPVANEDEFTFESVAGGTKVTRVTEAELGGFFRLAEPLVVRMLKRQFETNFANLKDLLEAQAEG